MKTLEVCEVEHYLPIDELQLHPENPRQISKERLEDLKDSIREKGIYQPFLVWTRGNIILAGNHRYLAVQELMREGYEFARDMPVVMEDVSEETALAILFESNNHYATWVEEKLADALRSAQESGQNLQSFGFDSDYVDVLLKSALSDAEAITSDPTRKIDPVDYDEISGAVIGEKDEYDSITMPRPVYENVTELLSKIARGLNDEWSEGDSYSEALSALVQFAREKGVEELWQPLSTTTKSSPKSRRKKSNA